MKQIQITILKNYFIKNIEYIIIYIIFIIFFKLIVQNNLSKFGIILSNSKKLAALLKLCKLCDIIY